MTNRFRAVGEWSLARQFTRINFLDMRCAPTICFDPRFMAGDSFHLRHEALLENLEQLDVWVFVLEASAKATAKPVFLMAAFGETCHRVVRGAGLEEGVGVGRNLWPGWHVAA